ncbi:probable mitochondrial adenine nucleotide transporter BTL3 [Euphorbia lathyris]|uniref:probable mitochondrial adenine nucleotide transporter BTL3 n=1 Tax=Euphorbia lathyris TaxID=212925 RepID=UPI0033133751
MYGHDLFFPSLLNSDSEPSDHNFFPGGLFLHCETICPSFVSFISSQTKFHASSCFTSTTLRLDDRRPQRKNRYKTGLFLSVSLSIKGNEEEEGCVGELRGNGEETKLVQDNAEVFATEEKIKVHKSGSAAFNTTKHLWAGAFSAMVSRTFIAPLERMKLEYVVRGEQRNLFELIKTISANEGLKGFWKGNFVNILRTAPFKSINFYAYDTYRNQLLKLSGNEEVTNFERFVAGAAAGVTATLLCLPMDTIRTKMVAPGGEALGGIIGTFHHMVQTEGFFSLYKGLVPSIVSMAPSGAVFYGVYDILKSAYLHSPEGKKRIENMKKGGQELNALEQLELGTIRTLLYGAIAGCCSEAATYPFEVVRRHLQMQVKATELNALATCAKIVEHGGVPALYAGLVPSLLQVLPSAAISYFVYEFMKIVLKVEST